MDCTDSRHCPEHPPHEGKEGDSVSARMERRNAILKGRMDARARYFAHLDVMRVHYETYKALAPLGMMSVLPPNWRAAA